MGHWYLLFCKRAEQDRAVIHLERQGVVCYYPKIMIEKFIRGVCKKQLEPLFPCYLFVKFDPEQISYTTVRSTRGVSRFIMQGAYPRVISETLILMLQQRELSTEYPQLSLLPQKGDKIQLQKGQFQGIPAVYLEPDGDTRSFMLIEILTKEVRVSVDNNEL